MQNYDLNKHGPILGLIDALHEVPYRDKLQLDAFLRQAERVIINTFSEDSPYRRQLKAIRFAPASFYSMESDYLQSWHDGKNAAIKLINQMLEDHRITPPSLPSAGPQPEVPMRQVEPAASAPPPVPESNVEPPKTSAESSTAVPVPAADDPDEEELEQLADMLLLPAPEPTPSVFEPMSSDDRGPGPADEEPSKPERTAPTDKNVPPPDARVETKAAAPAPIPEKIVTEKATPPAPKPAPTATPIEQPVPPQAAAQLEEKPDTTHIRMPPAIFLVHGQDQSMKETVVTAFQKLGIAVIDSQAPENNSKTILQKLSDHPSVACAAVLLSGDDLAQQKDQNLSLTRLRARQQVVFELGFLNGKFGRQKVFVLYNEDRNFEIPTNYFDLMYTPYDAQGRWQFDLIRMLKACGMAVDANRLL